MLVVLFFYFYRTVPDAIHSRSAVSIINITISVVQFVSTTPSSFIDVNVLKSVCSINRQQVRYMAIFTSLRWFEA